jgi:hypothetical protein
MAWHDGKHSGAILRATGLLLVTVAVRVAHALFHAPDAHARSEPICYLLACIGMASASAGAVLVVLGRHLFDQVELSSRWTIYRPGRARRPDGAD